MARQVAYIFNIYAARCLGKLLADGLPQRGWSGVGKRGQTGEFGNLPQMLIFLQFSDHLNMDKSLNIKIDGLLLTDDEVRMIALLIYGLSYTETSKCLGNTYKTVRNKVSYLYQRLELDELQALLRCHNSYFTHKISQAMPEAFEEYRMQIDTGLGFAHESSDMGKSVIAIVEQQILEGRVLNGEPADFDF